jgi:hypothetical protein
MRLMMRRPAAETWRGVAANGRVPASILARISRIAASSWRAFMQNALLWRKKIL